MDDQPRQLAPAARVYWAIAGAIPAFVILGSLAAALSVLNYSLAALGLVIAFIVFCGWWWWVTGRRFKAWSYLESDRELIIRRGVWIRRTTVVPYGRMQFVDVFQGPVDRLLKVSTVKLHTAAAASDATIPFVDQVEADRLRERLTELGESHAAGL